jgi:hypothetical protein
LGTINALPATNFDFIFGPDPANTIYATSATLTGDADAVVENATVRDTFLYTINNSFGNGLSINPFKLEPLPMIVLSTEATEATSYLSTIIPPFTMPAGLELRLTPGFLTDVLPHLQAGDTVAFQLNYTLIDEVTNATASNVLTVSFANIGGSANSGSVTFPSTLDGIEALYVGYFGVPGDLAGITSSLGQIFSGISLSSLAAPFATQAAAIAEYPFLASPQSATPAQIASFVDSVYEDLFDRAPTPTELTNAENSLTANLSNSQFIDTFIYNTILGAEGQDQTTIENQIGTAELTLYPQNDYLAITRTTLPVAQATAVVNEIIAGTTTETAYVNGLLSQVADTTIPVVAVEGSMYGVVGSSAVITSLVTNFLPGQLAYAHQSGLDPGVFACLETALVFAFSNEAGATTFANNFGPSNAAMPATAAGDAAFATAATNAIFGSAQTANTAPALLGYVHFLEGFFTAHGIVGVANPTADQIVIAARAGAWGEGIAIAEGNNLGPFPGQTTNFLEDAAQGTAVYSASLSSQPTAAPFQGATASSIQITGVAAHVDHAVM